MAGACGVGSLALSNAAWLPRRRSRGPRVPLDPGHSGDQPEGSGCCRAAHLRHKSRHCTPLSLPRRALLAHLGRRWTIQERLRSRRGPVRDSRQRQAARRVLWKREALVRARGGRASSDRERLRAPALQESTFHDERRLLVYFVMDRGPQLQDLPPPKHVCTNSFGRGEALRGDQQVFLGPRPKADLNAVDSFTQVRQRQREQ